MFRIVLALLLLLLASAPIRAQQQSCEAQLEEVKALNVQLRKAKAQSDFMGASVEEALTATQKRLAESEAKTKTAEVPPTPTNVRPK